MRSAMSTTATSTNRSHQASQSPSEAFSSVLNAAVASAAAKLERTTGQWADKLNDVAGGALSSDGLTELADEGLDDVVETGGVAESAGAEGVKAALHGKNPVWAAIKGAWTAGTPVVKAAIVASVVSIIVLLLVSPVLLLVFLLSLLIIAAVYRARAAKR
jgi:hypothetical protein